MFHQDDEHFYNSFSGNYHEEMISPPPPSHPPRTDASSSFFPFSPPTFHNDGHHLIRPTLNEPPSDPLPADQTPKIPILAMDVRTRRRRAVRTDRHSKIFTAQGPRDRRMRLSLEVARKFFDLQDMLGFDKASQTLNWLLTISESAIRDLRATSRLKLEQAFSDSSSSACEKSSALSDFKGKSPIEAGKSSTFEAEPISLQASKKVVLHPELLRESRANARVRAKERTREKNMIRGRGLKENSQPNHPTSSAVPFEAFNGESVSHDLKSSLDEQIGKPFNEILYELPMGTSANLHNHISNYNQNFIANHDMVRLLQEPCEMPCTDGTEEERKLLVDMQFYSRQWEVFDNSSIL